MSNIFDYKDSISEIRDVEAITILSEVDDSLDYTFGIVTFKRRNDLKEAIDSVLAQNGDIKFNLLVIDDCPERNDETEQLIISEYSSLKNLTYMKNGRNLGQAGNWNRLFVFCKTKFLIMLHDDDVLLPDFIERMNYFVGKNPDVSAINSGKISWDGNQAAKEQFVERDDRLEVHTRHFNFPGFLFSAPSGCLFRVRDIIEVGGFDGEVFPSFDYVLIEKLTLKGKLVLKTKQYLMLYRIVGNASAKLDTQLKWVEIDYRLKEELGKLLDYPSFYVKMVINFAIRLRLREIVKQKPNYTYRGYTPGGKLFLIRKVLFEYLYEHLYINRQIKKC